MEQRCPPRRPPRTCRPLAVRLFYHLAELNAQSASNNWTPHGGSWAGQLTLVAQPVDSPDPSTGYDKWSQVVYANIVQPTFNGRSWGLMRAATVVLEVLPGVSSGTVGLQLELACGGAVHFLPSASSLHEMPFTTAWQTVLPPPSRRRLRAWAPQPRRLQVDARGDVTGDGVTNTLDLTAIVNYFKDPATINLGAMNANREAPAGRTHTTGLAQTNESAASVASDGRVRSPSRVAQSGCGSTRIATA